VTHTAPPEPGLAERVRSAYAGRHTITTAGAVAEPDALPLPSWGTFLGLSLGAAAAVSGVVYAVLFGSDERWLFLLLALAWALMGGFAATAAARLRRPEPANALIVIVGAVDLLAGGLIVAYRGAHGLGALLAIAALALAFATVREAANVSRWDRERHPAGPEPDVEAGPITA
jgi:uncharacterized membrane protein HdeD (DUF308 family)